jgi:dTDP-4-dehydrorhamnose 3,5-epimerase
MPFVFEKTSLKGAVLLKPKVYHDERGFFMETFKYADFVAAGLSGDYVQDNHSKSSKGVLRGLHYQRGVAAQGKLLRCTAGAILDVGVDIRRCSPTFGKWLAVELSAKNAHMLYLAPGFAHGFLTLSDTAELQYKCTAPYSAADEGGVRWDDPELAIEWGIREPMISQRDAELPFLKDAEL